jgi:hypothetical protein
MLQKIGDKRTVWMVIGLVAGLGIATLWPHEQVKAVATDRDAQFAMTTCQVGVIDPIEAIFVLDFLTGSLKGAVLNRTNASFTNFFFRDLPQDFGIDPKKEAHYCMVTGLAQLATSGASPPATSVIYVGEMTTGKIICYGFQFVESAQPLAPRGLYPVAKFPFREPDPAE